MITKQQLQEAWEKAKANGGFLTIDDLINNLPDEPKLTEVKVTQCPCCEKLDAKVEVNLPEQPSWEKKFDEQFNSKITTTLSVFGPEITVLDTWFLATPDKIKDFIRAELKAMGEEIKKELLPERYYPDVKQYVINENWVDGAIHKVLKKRGL